MSFSRGARPDEPERVVIRDNRRIDPVTGAVRKPAEAPAGGAQAPPAAAEGGVSAAPETGATLTDGKADDVFTDVPVPDADVQQVAASLLEDRTHDLQRVQAEYANYRKRADRERLAAGDMAVGRTLVDLLPVVDDLDRAKAHGDLTGALKAIADKLDGVFARLGLAAFGAVGDPFDPSIHDAVMHDESDAVTVPTCTSVLRPGYRHHERLLRPAMVGVSDPATAPSVPADSAPDLATDTLTDGTAAVGPPANPHQDEPAPSQQSNPAAETE